MESHTRLMTVCAAGLRVSFCWSHLRRQFVKIEREAAPAQTPVNPRGPRAHHPAVRSRDSFAADLMPSAVRASKHMPGLWPQP